MKSKRRFQDHGDSFVAVKRLAGDAPAVRDARTHYRARVATPEPDDQVFKSGEHSRKIGKLVTKGRWAGMPIFTLTLEERATCPRDCSHWTTCFGNKMNWSTRWAAGPALERAIERGLAELSAAYPNGYVIRLHVLGDFYSTAYVDFWAAQLNRHRALRIFGYTARDPEGDPIGRQLDAISRARWDRFAIRFSNRWRGERSALTLWRPGRVPASAGIVCPAQTGRSECCGTCGLCWNSRANIFFQLH